MHDESKTSRCNCRGRPMPGKIFSLIYDSDIILFKSGICDSCRRNLYRKDSAITRTEIVAETETEEAGQSYNSFFDPNIDSLLCKICLLSSLKA